MQFRKNQIRFLLSFVTLPVSASGCASHHELVLYDVQGQSIQDLRRDITEKSPSASFGNTRSTQTLETKMESAQEGCRLVGIKFTQAIEISMPRWIDSKNARSCLRKNFQDTWDQVLIHEYRHRDINLKLDSRVKSRIGSIGLFPNCDELDAEVTRRFELLQAEIKEEHEHFHKTGPALHLEDC